MTWVEILNLIEKRAPLLGVYSAIDFDFFLRGVIQSSLLQGAEELPNEIQVLQAFFTWYGESHGVIPKKWVSHIQLNSPNSWAARNIAISEVRKFILAHQSAGIDFEEVDFQFNVDQKQYIQFFKMAVKEGYFSEWVVSEFVAFHYGLLLFAPEPAPRNGITHSDVPGFFPRSRFAKFVRKKTGIRHVQNPSATIIRMTGDTPNGVKRLIELIELFLGIRDSEDNVSCFPAR